MTKGHCLALARRNCHVVLSFPTKAASYNPFCLLDLCKQNLNLPIFYSLIFYLTLKDFCTIGFLASAIKISAEGQDSFCIDAHSLKISFVPEIP
jgi:hypothetical protein